MFFKNTFLYSGFFILVVLGSCSLRVISQSKTQDLSSKKEALIIASTDFHGALEGESIYFKSNKITQGGAPLLLSLIHI